MPKRPRKLVVYLDQNFISEMSKPADRKVRPDFRALYDVLHKNFWDEKLLVPRSGFHDIESSLAGTLRGPIRERQSTLGHVDLETFQHVKECQITRSIHRYLGKDGAGEVIDFEDAFEANPDDRLRHLDIDVDWDRSLGVKKQRYNLASQLEGVRRPVYERRVSHKEQLRIELRGVRDVALRPGDALHYCHAAKMTPAQFKDFVEADAFAEVPVVDLEASLMARLLTSNKPIGPGDVTDLDALATYLPYCHVYGADKNTAAIARSVAADKKYECELFDSSVDGVRKLIAYLDGALSAMSPVNVPYMSVFVAPTADVKANAWELFRKLGSKAKEAERDWGRWVELFGFDDGAMPTYRLEQIPDVPAPFFGLQEVLSKRCEPGLGGEPLIHACRVECRSTHFVVVETFQGLPEEFVMGAVWAKERGEGSYLQWQIHAR